MPGIVVGIDDSANAQHVLDWATREAGIQHADLTVVTVVPTIVSQWGTVSHCTTRAAKRL